MNTLRAIPLKLEWNAHMPVYASEAFLSAVGDRFGWIGGMDDTGHLRCVLPYVIIRKVGFHFVRFQTGTITLAHALGVDEERSFLKAVVEHFRASRADMIIPGTNAAVFRAYPEGATPAPYATFVKDLGRPEERLFSEIHTDYRKKIRSATRAGVQVKSGMQYLEASYSIITDSLRRSGADVIQKYPDFRKRILSLGENVRIFIAEYEGVPHACLVAPFSAYGAYAYYGGTIPDPQKGAMHLVYWDAIRQFREMGVKHFDFQGVRINPELGSKQEGIRSFKQRFGGRLIEGYMWKYSLRPLKSFAYSIGVRLLKGGDIVDQEQHKLRNDPSSVSSRSDLIGDTEPDQNRQ